MKTVKIIAATTAQVARLAKKLGVDFGDIVKAECWANVIFVAIRGVGGRFISYKKAPNLKPGFGDETVEVKVNSGTNFKKAVAELKAVGGRFNPSAKTWSIKRRDVNDYLVTVCAPRPRSFDLNYEMYNPNGMFFG